MKLFLVRHAEAEPGDGKPDELRALTPVGIQDASQVGKTLLRCSNHYDLILTSPILRAKDTAKYIQRELRKHHDVLIEEDSALGIPSDFQQLRSRLQSLVTMKSHIILVSHMPFIGECIAYWSTGHAHPGIHVPKSGIVILEGEKCNRGEMKIEAFLPLWVQKLVTI